MTNLLDRLSDRVRTEEGDPGAPLSPQAIDEAEQRLGFRLHPLLASVYREVADGGFGPDHGMLALHGEAVEAYLTLRRAGEGTEWAWPEGVLPILDWGCGMYAAVDCRSDDGTVLLFEPNPGDPDAAWFVDAESLAGWFEHHLAETGWWNAVEEGDDPGDMPLWAGRR